MGGNKLLASVGGKPMILRAVDAALGSGARPVVVVTGHEAEALTGLLKERDVRLVHNPDYGAGMSTSLRAGLAALPADCDGALVCLADMPGIDAEHLERLIAAFDPAEGRAIIVPTHGDHRGNPVLWAARFFPEMAAVKGDVGARHLIGEYNEMVREVPFDDPSVLLDIDTPEALAEVRGSTP
jgi:molybdenum cofactor cytidylyltransferase